MEGERTSVVLKHVFNENLRDTATVRNVVQLFCMYWTFLIVIKQANILDKKKQRKL